MSFTATKCSRENNSWFFSIKNNSGKAIYYAISTTYPDTNLKNIGDPPGIILNRSYKTTYRINANEETQVNSGVFAINKVILLYVFDATILEKEPWDSIVANYNVLNRYQLNRADIQNNNRTLTYP